MQMITKVEHSYLKALVSEQKQADSGEDSMLGGGELYGMSCHFHSF